MNVRSLAIYRLSQPRLYRALRRSNAPIKNHNLLWVSPAATYIICTNPRSGSWLLSEGLASTSLAGKPREWFNTMQEQQHRARWRMDHSSNLTYETYLQLARAESLTSNGISGVKLHYSQFVEFSKKMQTVENFRGLSAAQIMARLFPQAKYLWLTRRDKARQAISLFLASQTGEWWKIEDATPDRREGSTRNPEFDPDAIARFEQALIKNDSKWLAFFEQSHIAPLVIYYEDLVNDYSGTIINILKWLAVPHSDAVYIPPTRLKKQSNALNEEWLARYETFKGCRTNPVQTPASDESDKSPTEHLWTTHDRIHDAWKQWIAQSKLLKTNNNAIVEVLTDNGYSHVAALTEVRKAAADPYVLGAARTYRRLSKAVSLLNMQEQLARLSQQSIVIERRRILSRDEFRDKYYAANRPVIIQELMDDWKAMTKWTPAYLKSVAGGAIIEVMTGRNADPEYEINNQRHRREMRFAHYIDMVYSGINTNDYYMVANNGFFQRSEAKPLLQDFTAFSEYLTPTIGGQQCFLWFGPGGTVTPLHHDTSNILLAQVAGRKLYRLIPASQWKYVYNSNGVFSDVDCERPDLIRHPNFRHATVIDVVLEPGEVLFMPVGWWHHVRALDVSMTVSFTNFLLPNHFTWG